jgi:hypothetical protein
MITTNDVKAQMPVFTTGRTGQAQEVILIVGSCRCVPYLNYVARWNTMQGEPYRIHFIEPWDQHWNAAGEPHDFEAALVACEKDERILSALRETTIFIHEHYESAGMFNTLPDAQKNIFQFGLSPRLNITIPNFHDHHILFTEQVQFDERKRELVRANGGVPSRELFEEMKEFGRASCERFYKVCRLSSFPEMESHFGANWRSRRMFWKGNHVSKHFTLRVFADMNERFLHWNLLDVFWREAFQEDLYANVVTPMTQYDVDAYGLTWPEEAQPLRLP